MEIGGGVELEELVVCTSFRGVIAIVEGVVLLRLISFDELVI